MLPGAESEFWEYLDQLVTHHTLVIDRPRGSHHPRYAELVYPLDYGYLAGTTTVDGAGLDVFLGFQAGPQPEKTLDALALTVDLEKRDVEIKLLLGCSQAEKELVLRFLNGGSMRASLVQRQARLALLRSRRGVRRF